MNNLHYKLNFSIYKNPFFQGQVDCGPWKYGSAIGFIGLAETLKALTGKHHGEDAASQALGLKNHRT